MKYYDAMRHVPEEAQKKIKGGRLEGMTDINPMWRIKVMTETFGVCGIGWKYEITKQWNEAYGNEVKAFVNINLYIKVDGEWSEPIQGTGGSTLVEPKGYVNDEAYKMALTDALSVAMKALGVAADVYFAKDAKYDTKYAQQEYAATLTKKQASKPVAQPVVKSVIVEETIEQKIAKATKESELVALFSTLSADEQNEYRTRFTQRKLELKGGSK